MVLLRKGGERSKGVNLYIRNILRLWIFEEFREFFKFYGNIINSKVFIELMLGCLKGVGFIFYDLKVEVEIVINVINNIIFVGCLEIMYVRFVDEGISKLKFFGVVSLVGVFERLSFNFGE